MGDATLFCGFDGTREYGEPSDLLMPPRMAVAVKAYPVGLFSRLVWPLVRCAVNVRLDHEDSTPGLGTATEPERSA